MLEEAIAHYHGLLDPDTARATQQQLTDEQRARNLFFGERPLMSVLRPRFITGDQYALIQRACGLVAGAAQRLAPALLGVSVAQISLLINTQIASQVGTGAVSWLTYADRLMEFPTGLLGVEQAAPGALAEDCGAPAICSHRRPASNVPIPA